MIKLLQKFSLSLLSQIYKLYLLVTAANINIIYSKGAVNLSFFKVNGKNKIYVGNNTILWNNKIHINGNNNYIEFEDNVKFFNSNIFIDGNNSIIKFGGGRYITKTSFDLLDDGNKLTVGKNTGFNNNRIVVAGKDNYVKIGEDCIFAENAEVWSSDTHSIVDTVNNKRINFDKPIIIGNHVWVGNRALILKGVKIGNDAIVAAGSIVTKDLHNNSLSAGVPAKVINRNITWDIDRI